MAGKIVVLAFEGEHTADGMLDNFLDMEKRGLLVLEDVVVAVRPARSTEVRLEQTRHKRGRAATKAGSIGLLAGLLVGGPLVGLTVGALWGGLRDKGIDDKFVKELSSHFGPDTSGLFLLVAGGDADKVIEELRPFKATVISTEIDPAVEKKLREALAD